MRPRVRVHARQPQLTGRFGPRKCCRTTAQGGVTSWLVPLCRGPACATPYADATQRECTKLRNSLVAPGCAASRHCGPREIRYLLGRPRRPKPRYLRDVRDALTRPKGRTARPPWPRSELPKSRGNDPWEDPTPRSYAAAQADRRHGPWEVRFSSRAALDTLPKQESVTLFDRPAWRD